MGDSTAPACLADFIVAEVHRQTTEEALRTKVEGKIGECVKEAVDRAFRSYGDVGKQIEEAVAKSLRIENHLDVPAYGVMVMAALRAKMDETLSGLINERLSAEMDEILKIAPKEVKLEEIVKTMISGLEDDHDRWGSHVTCIIEESEYSAGYHYVYLDEDEDKRKYECSAQVSIDKQGKIYGLKIGQRDAKTTIIMGPRYGWEKMIFAAYCSGSILILPEYEPSTYIGRD